MVNKCKIMKIGDKVKIIQRKPGNDTGIYEYNKPNGDVGKIGYIRDVRYSSNRPYQINSTPTGVDDVYFGLFDEDDIELITDKPNYEIF